MKPEIRHILATKGTPKKRTEFIEEAIRHYHQQDLPQSVRLSLLAKENSRLRLELAGNEAFIQELEEELTELKTRLSQTEVQYAAAIDKLDQPRQTQVSVPQGRPSPPINLNRLPKMTSEERHAIRRDLRVQELEKQVERMNSDKGLTGEVSAKVNVPPPKGGGFPKIRLKPTKDNDTPKN